MGPVKLEMERKLSRPYLPHHCRKGLPLEQIDQGEGYRWLTGNGLRSSSWPIDRMDIADTGSRLALQGIGLQPLGFY